MDNPELKTISELTTLTTVDPTTDWVPVVDDSDKTDSSYGTTKKALVNQFIGPIGNAATADAGTTTTGLPGTNASVVNSGTVHAAVFDFTIPRGATGAQGIQGNAGADGANAYCYIAYASDASGTDFTNTFNAALNYIAILSTDTEITTPVVTDFAGLWKNYKGATGAQGIQGVQGNAGTNGTNGTNGTDGDDAYCYIAYASDDTGTGFTNTFDAALNYIAIKSTATAIVSPVASDFTGLWKNYKGATGAQGIQGIQGNAGTNGTNGTNGTDGEDAYVYIAYASDASGTGFTLTFDALLDYIAVKNTTTAIASPVASDFTGLWKNYKGATGATGPAGAGSGDVLGPATNTDNHIPQWNGTNSKILKDGLVLTTTVASPGIDTNIPTEKAVRTAINGFTSYTDEQAQDAVGAMLVDTATIDLTYTDATPELKADVKDASITNAKIANMNSKTYKGRTSASTGIPEDVAVATLKTDLGLVKADVGLGNVDNTSDATKNSAAVTLTNKTLTSPVINVGVSGTAIDTDGALTANSDTKVASQKATKTYTDTKIAKTTNITALNETGIADGEIAVFNLTNKDIRTSDKVFSTDGTLVGNSDANIPTQKAVKTYVDGTKFTWKGAWITSTSYILNDAVQQNGSGYICSTAHTSGTFATDLAAGKWSLFVEGVGGNSIQVDCSGGTSDTYGILAGLVNSSNTVYTVSLGKYISGSLRVYLNGQLQTQGSSEDWVETTPASGTFTFNTAPTTGDIIIAMYQFTSGTTGNADTLDGLHLSSIATLTGAEALTNKTIDGDLNTVQDLPYSAIKGVAWTAFTPSWTGITVGSATNTGVYCRVGNTIHYRVTFTLAANTSVTSFIYCAFPVTPLFPDAFIRYGAVCLNDSGTRYIGNHWGDGEVGSMNSAGTSLVTAPANATTPFTWATGDQIFIAGTYEAA